MDYIQEHSRKKKGKYAYFSFHLRQMKLKFFSSKGDALDPPPPTPGELIDGM